MGYFTAKAMTESGGSLDKQLMYHFTGNCYPPLPIRLIPTAKQAIERAKEGKYDDLLELPEGVTHKGSNKATVRQCINGWRLDAFID